MSSFTVGIPFVRPVNAPGKFRRAFEVPAGIGENVSSILGEIIRDFLVSTNDERKEQYSSLPIENLPEVDELLYDVPDDIWRKHGFVPKTDWEALNAG